MCVALATLYPFDFGLIEKDPRLGFFGRTLRLSDSVDIAGNMLLFLPVGAVLAHLDRRQHGRRTMLFVAAPALVASGLIEILQMYLPDRNSALSDILSNTAGAVVGAALRQRWAAAVRQLRASVSRRLMGYAMLVFMLLTLSLSAALQLRTRLSNWSADYPLLIGNEETGDRPWNGRVFWFELTDGATERRSLERFAAGEPISLAGARIAAVDLSGDAPYADASGTLPVIASVGHVEEPSASNRTGDGRWLRTAGAAAALAERLRRTNAFTLRVRCASDGPDQQHDARIITNSANPYHRNFTLGQRRGALFFRFRTPHTGLNGMRPEVVVPAVFRDTQLLDILVTYDGATLSVVSAGSEHVSRMRLSPGSSLMSLGKQYIGAHHVRSAELRYLVVLFIAAGSLVGVVIGPGLRSSTLCAAWMLAFPLVMQGTMAFVSGRTPEPSELAFVGVLGAGLSTLSAGTIVTVTGNP